MAKRIFLVLTVIVISFSISSCKTSQTQVDDLKTEVGVLQQRIDLLEKTQQEMERTSSDQAEEEGYLKGKAQKGTSAAKAATLSKKDIQKALKNAGFYNGPVDGVIGKQTRRAIKDFQKDNGLKVDGIVGEATSQKLSAYLR